uniref:VLIG-type G domain-containing protein n=1 Tax=Cyprinus carpio carpio TaxID=630221 RepID=A0A9J8C9Y4_CYPCA
YVYEESCFKLLENLGLVDYYDKKLTLHTVLQIDKTSITDVPVQSLSDLPWLFLKRLMMLQRTARSVKCSSSDGTEDSEWDDDQENESDCPQSVNPLDILTAVFLCSDSFLQQEIIIKMSMCQFAVPLLLPNTDKNQITLMLWAMRDIVKKYRPHSLLDPSAFVEERIALSELPLVSFVRLGRCNISKSEILNKLLSNPQQYTDTFVHFNMDCGNISKKISDGLVEMAWYLPCGNENIDVFPEPVAIANLRGDIQSFETQYTFLCEASTAVFVFFESQLLDSQLISVPSQKSMPQLFFCGRLQQQQHKKLQSKCQDICGNKTEIAELDKKISDSSLGVEHFIREMSQLYEAAVLLPENALYQKQLEHLPKLCAQLLLDGFSLELVDGDSSNIPEKWITSVFSELNTLVEPKNKIMVVTVLGVQSSGKSTLLNTMFGVQFAVSSGRCTRGAFIQLIKVTEERKAELHCDYIVIIDTEGLKSPELAQLDNSYEHDNELATLVVGLSDVTIVNIAMENSTEMKDILQIIVHAFLRMEEIGKKHTCLFVHQNVADVSAHVSNMRDRKFLLEQLDEMTQAAAKMENKLEFKKFTDLMNYDTETGDHYIPGLWHGNPPMAPVSIGYSESSTEGLIERLVHFQNKNLLIIISLP